MNRLPWRFDALNGTTGFTYDASGNLLSVTDPRSNATAYAYVTMDGLATRVAAKPQQKKKKSVHTETPVCRATGRRIARRV